MPLFEIYVPWFNKDAKYRVLLSEVSTIIQQGMWYIDSIIQLSQNIGPGFNKDASYHVLLSEVCAGLDKGGIIIANMIRLS